MCLQIDEFPIKYYTGVYDSLTRNIFLECQHARYLSTGKWVIVLNTLKLLWVRNKMFSV